MATAIATLRGGCARRPAGGPFAIGGGVNLYVGDPSFDVPRWTVTGEPARIAHTVRDLVALGVNHVAVRIPSRAAARSTSTRSAPSAATWPRWCGRQVVAPPAPSVETQVSGRVPCCSGADRRTQGSGPGGAVKRAVDATTTQERYSLWIGGDRAGGSNGTYEVINPATEEVVGLAPEATAADARQARLLRRGLRRLVADHARRAPRLLDRAADLLQQRVPGAHPARADGDRFHRPDGADGAGRRRRGPPAPLCARRASTQEIPLPRHRTRAAGRRPAVAGSSMPWPSGSPSASWSASRPTTCR